MAKRTADRMPVSSKFLAREAGMARRTAQQHLKKMAENGHVEKKTVRGKTRWKLPVKQVPAARALLAAGM